MNINSSLVPMVIERSGQSERSFDIFSRMLRDRVVFFTGVVEDNSCSLAIAQLLFLESENSEQPIYLYVNSPGGSVSAGMGLVSTMKFIKPPVYTIATGMVASMGSVIASSGEKGHRYMLKDTHHLIHQPMSGTGDGRTQASDIKILADNIQRTKERLTNVYVENTGQTYEQLEKDMDRDTVMTAKQSIEYGLADYEITTRDELNKRLESM